MSKARNYAFKRRKIRRAISAGADFGGKTSGRRLVTHKYGAGIGRATRDGVSRPVRDARN